MRVHFLASTLVRGGAETMAWALSRRLVEAGHDVAWTLLREPGDLVDAAAFVDLEARVALGRGWSGVRRVSERLRGADALYVLDHRNAIVLGAIAGYRARVKRRVVAVHTTRLWGGGASLARSSRLALRAYHAVLALSETHSRFLEREEGVPAAKIRIVPNGIDLRRFHDLPSSESARAALGLPLDAPVVGTVAVLRPEKNLALLLDAASLVRSTFPDLRVLLVGDGPERGRLEERAAREDLSGVVSFLGRREDVPSILPALDVFVLSSLPVVETQPVAVMEAMAAGRPVVATPVGDLPSLLENGEAGVLAEGDARSMAQQIVALLTDSDRRRVLSERARAAALEFDLGRSTEALLAVLEGS